MALRDFIRTITPGFLLSAYRKQKKANVRAALEADREAGRVLTQSQLVDEIRSLGIVAGDTVLVHSSMSRIGYLEHGPDTFIDAFLEVLGPQGNLLMPSSPNPELQAIYIRKNKVFDVRDTPSMMGKITEVFRKRPNVMRSAHPTEPVCAFGPDAAWLTEGHLGEETPYTARSPFCRLYEKQGKILYIGVTLINAGTNLHTLEDAVDFPYPVYLDEMFDVTVIDKEGNEHSVKTRVHNPEFSAKRKCDELIPMFIEQGVMQKGKLGKADVLIVDGPGFFQAMKVGFKKGITMYNPKGEKL